ncbi:MAG: hypothetical protein JWN10_82, partial [Solirubrobacterales bacterium]|nr:hypothetical protein [Solirubrobacterales bacterium]
MNFESALTSYVTVDLILWQQQGSLVLSPKFQRRPVWKAPARSYLMDTLLRGYPVPPLHIRLLEDSKTGVMREVVDGQQRLRALFDFVDGTLRLGRSLDGPWSGLTFEQLSPELQSKIKMYKFPVFQYQGLEDETVLEIFSRINTYSVSLNAQELRNGKWFGQFKQTVYSLALEFLEYWRRFSIFTEGAIARMQEAELVSELLVMQMDGLQDKKASLDSFYAALDEEWGSEALTFQFKKEDRPAEWLSRSESAERLRRVLAEIGESVGSVLQSSEFRRVPLFYTLYGAVYHRLYGLPGATMDSPHRGLKADTRRSLLLAVTELSELLADKPDTENLRGWKRAFLLASARQTDNIGPRLSR